MVPVHRFFLKKIDVKCLYFNSKYIIMDLYNCIYANLRMFNKVVSL